MALQPAAHIDLKTGELTPVTGITFFTGVYYVNKDGNTVTVSFQGSVNSEVAQYGLIATISSGYRPSKRTFATGAYNASNFASMYIEPTGEIHTYTVIPSGSSIMVTATFVID